MNAVALVPLKLRRTSASNGDGGVARALFLCGLDLATADSTTAAATTSPMKVSIPLAAAVAISSAVGAATDDGRERARKPNVGLRRSNSLRETPSDRSAGGDGGIGRTRRRRNSSAAVDDGGDIFGRKLVSEPVIPAKDGDGDDGGETRTTTDELRGLLKKDAAKESTMPAEFRRRTRRIKAADGGFFENFGTLDKSVAIKRYQSVKKTQQRTAVTPVDCDPAPGSRDDDFYPTSVPVIRDSSASKLIECCVDKDSEELAQLGEEVLYVVLHSPALSDSRRNRLIRHVADVFKLGDDQKRISLVRDKTPPRWKLDITVHEGRKLKENQPDGSSDPYCELSVFDPSSCDAKSAERQFRTGVKFRTLHPQWEESFTAEPIDHTSEILQITVRDQAAEEIHLKERVKQIEQVKGVKGAYRYVRNVAQAISPGQTGGHSSHSMLGKVVVKLKEIPAGRTSDWFSVERKAKISLDGKPRQMVKKGELRMTLNCSGVNQIPISSSNLRLFFKTIVEHEVERNEISAQPWQGDLSDESGELINCFLGYWAVREEQMAVAYWLAAWQIFKEGKRLDYIVLRKRLMRLPSPDDADCLGTTERAAMSSTLMDCWSSLLRDISYHRFLIAKKHVTGAHTVDILLKTLKVVGQLLKLWGLGGSNFGDSEEVKHALSRGNHHWYQHILAMAEGDSACDDAGDHDLKVHIEVVNNIAQDLYDGRVLFQRVFYENVGVDYLSIAFKDFEGKILSDVKPMVKRWCEELRRLSVETENSASTSPTKSSGKNAGVNGTGSENGSRCPSTPPTPPGRNSSSATTATLSSSSSSMPSLATPDRQLHPQQDAFYVLGSQAFELYMGIQNVVKEKEKSVNLMKSKEDAAASPLDYHNWFEPVMYYWIRIAQRKAATRTVKAIELDSWSRMDDHVFHSMSAVNTTGIFHNIVVFWRNLDWPDPKGAFVIACHVMRCISECGEKYAEEVSRFLEKTNYLSTGEEFEVTPQLCAALSSIEHVKLNLRRVPDLLDADRLLSKIYARGGKGENNNNSRKISAQEKNNARRRHVNDDRLNPASAPADGRRMGDGDYDGNPFFPSNRGLRNVRNERNATSTNDDEDDSAADEDDDEDDVPETPSSTPTRKTAGNDKSRNFLLRRRRKETPVVTKHILTALSEIMKATCEPPASASGSRHDSSSTPTRRESPTRDEYAPSTEDGGGQESRLVDGPAPVPAPHPSHSSPSSPSVAPDAQHDPDKLRDMLTSTRRAVKAIMEFGMKRMTDELTAARQAVVGKLIGSLISSLQECCRRSSSGSSKLLQKTLSRVDSSLACLFNGVPADIFQEFIDDIWEAYLKDADNLAKKPTCDAPLLLEATTSMFEMCRGKAETADEGNAVYSDLVSKLSLRSVPTPHLILKYFERRRRGAADVPETATNGLVTVQACKTDGGVYVYILNGRDMRGHGRDAPDSYISVRLFGPWCDDDQKLDNGKAKTLVQKQDKTPLYEHPLNFEVPPNADKNEAVLIITANDQHHFKRNYFLGEAVLPVSEISENVPPNERIRRLPQIPLALTLPGSSEEELEILRVLQTRTDDKLATEFVKKQRRRIPKMRGGYGSQMSVMSSTSSVF